MPVINKHRPRRLSPWHRELFQFTFNLVDYLPAYLATTLDFNYVIAMLRLQKKINLQTFFAVAFSIARIGC